MEKNKIPMMATTAALSVAMLAIALWAPVRSLLGVASHVLRPQNFVALYVSKEGLDGPSSLWHKLLDISQDLQLTDLGSPGFTELPKEQQIASIDEAAKLLGYMPLMPQYLPDGLPKIPSLRGYTAGTTTLAVNVRKLREVLAQVGLEGIQLPDSYDGAKVTLDTWPAVVAVYSNGATGQFVALAQSRPPALAIDGRINIETLRQQVLDSGLLPQTVAAQLRSIDDWTTTLPMPVPEGATAKEVPLRNTHVLFVTSPSGHQTLGLWYERGRVIALWTNLPEDDAIKVVESLH